MAITECDRCGKLFSEKDSHKVCLDGCSANPTPEEYFERYEQWEVCPSCYEMFKMFMAAWKMVRFRNDP